MDHGFSPLHGCGHRPPCPTTAWATVSCRPAGLRRPPVMRVAFLVLALLLLGGFRSPGQQTSSTAPVPTAAPGAENLAKRLQELEARTDLDEARKGRIRKDFQDAIALIAEIAEDQAALESFRRDVETAAAEAKAAREQMASLPPPSAAGQVAGVDPKATALEIDQLGREADSTLARLKSRLADLEKELKDQRERPGQLLAELEAARTTSRETAASLNAEPATLADPVEREARAAVLEARRMAAEGEIRVLEEEQLSYQPRLDRLTATRDLKRREVAAAEARAQALGNLFKQRRADETDRARREAEEALRDAADMHPVIQRLAEGNADLSRELAEVTEQANRVAGERKEITAKIGRLTRDAERAETQIKMAGLSESFAAVLLDQRLRLPQRTALRRQRLAGIDELGKARLASFRIEQIAEEIEVPAEAAARIVRDGVDGPLTDVQRALLESQAQDQLEARLDMVAKLQIGYAELIREIASLDFEQAQYASKVEDYARFLDERLLWIRSSEPLRPSTIRDTARALHWLGRPGRWSEAGLALADVAGRRPLLLLAALVLAVGLSARRKALRRHLESVAAYTRKLSTDRFTYTIRALYLSVLRTVPLLLFAAFVGWQFQQIPAASDWIRALGVALVRTSWIAGTGIFLRDLCLPKGVGCAHFRWRDDGARILRRWLAWFVPVAGAFNLVAVTCNWSGTLAHANSLGRLAFIGGVLSLGLFLQRVLRPAHGILAGIIEDWPNGWISRTRFLWFAAGAGIPFALAVAAAAGYYLAAVTMLRSMLTTLALFTAAVVVYALLLRWFSIRARRLAVRQAVEQRRARREAAPGEFDDGQIPDIEESKLDTAALREQTRGLLQLVVGGLVIAGLWFIWADVLPAFGFLRTIAVGSSLTLDRLLLALLVAVLTLIAAKRAPALLEILIPQALPLKAGSRYAIIALSQYSLVLAGFVVAFNILGIDWSRIGWILTALSVGLGFGLQEVVANFVCGMILLFEQPIRVGDIVTVADVTGVVSKIRIRATTVTDWDRKEFVVPNKEFITGHILNWTLSNPINRLTIPVGIAYGSDTDKARDAILDICRRHPNLLEDPAPFVTFEKFGDSSLNLVLRAYLPNLDKRLQTIHELNTEIHKRFAAEGIVIAFPQLDVHFDAPRPDAGPS